MDKENKPKCEKGYHYHPQHPKSDENGCMKDEDMKERFGSISIYNAVRCQDQRRLNNSTTYLGV